MRLTAEDGYQAQRSYSIASAPEARGEVELAIERIPDGEVSPYFHDVLMEGDQVELRGPIGGYFVWEPGMGGPLLLVGGGSGVVPLMAMLRERRAADDRMPALLLYSSRTIDDVIYRDELDGIVRRARRADRGPYPDPRAAARLGRLRPTHRRADAGRRPGPHRGC